MDSFLKSLFPEALEATSDIMEALSPLGLLVDPLNVFKLGRIAKVPKNIAKRMRKDIQRNNFRRPLNASGQVTGGEIKQGQAWQEGQVKPPPYQSQSEAGYAVGPSLDPRWKSR
jgi:hypothetical protein